MTSLLLVLACTGNEDDADPAVIPWLDAGARSLTPVPAPGSDGRFTHGRASALLRRHAPKQCVRLYGLPLWGVRLSLWTLHDLTHDGSPASLLRGVARFARESGVNVVLVPLFEGDPSLKWLERFGLNRWLPPSGVTRLYASGPAAGLLFAEPRLRIDARDA